MSATVVLTLEEREQIEWLLATLKLDHEFTDYVRREMNDFEILTRISQGRLPSLAKPGGVELRSGEIVHAYANADLIMRKILKSGPAENVHRGFVLLLDNTDANIQTTHAKSSIACHVTCRD